MVNQFTIQGLWSNNLDSRSPSWFLHLSHHGDICVLNQQFLHPGGELVQHVLRLRAVVTARVAALGDAEVQQRLPAVVLAEDMWVAHNDQESFGSKHLQ